MFCFFRKFLVLFLSLLLLEILPEGESYEPPATVGYPLGDESLNNDILTNPSISEKSQKDFKTFPSNCARATSDIPKDPHVQCPGDDIGTPNDILFSTNVLRPSPELSCKRCDLQVQKEKDAVIVHCYECYEVEKNSTKRDIVYLAYFLEIPTYSSGNDLNWT